MSLSAPHPQFDDQVEISIIRGDNSDRSSEIYLLLREGKPIELGSGRFALVWLASEGGNVASSRLLALKFVRNSPESTVINSVARWRFFEEILKTSQHATPANPGLIEYIGFGTLSSAPLDWVSLDAKRNDINGRSEYAFFAKKDCRKVIDQVQAANKTALEALRAANRASLADYFGAGISAKLQGEFYAMLAAHGTLEDLLARSHDWSSNKIYARPDSATSLSMDRFRKSDDKQKRIAQFMSKFSSGTAKPTASHSGLSIISDLNSPQLRNRIVLLLAHRISLALASLHSCNSDGEGSLAHRDLKLGNFLLVGKTVSDLSIAVADLGFVGGQESLAASSLTGSLNAREAFVLPPGTFPFRAPEQIQPVYEVTCSAANPREATFDVLLQTFTEVDLEVGDWLESPDLLFGDEKQREKRAKIETLAWKEDRLRAGRSAQCKLSCAVDLQGKDEARGSVIKAAGLHSDIFSLGAIIYFIVTGGRNPETFWSRCVALAQQPVRATQPSENGKEESIFDTCQSLAIALCNDGSDLFDKDIEHLKGDTILTRRMSFRDPKDQEAKVLTHSPTVKSLLNDLCGMRIALPIMLIILRCMLRGKPDSFVKPLIGTLLPISLWPLQDRARECAEECLLSINYPSAKIVLDEFLTLGLQADEILLTLRIVGLRGPDSKTMQTVIPASP
jgi:serine/threonine protein kinase